VKNGKLRLPRRKKGDDQTASRADGQGRQRPGKERRVEGVSSKWSKTEDEDDAVKWKQPLITNVLPKGRAAR
jgi:hypothetical protein